jgi:pimeloyl-ACP methyl ester carboxylesterase
VSRPAAIAVLVVGVLLASAAGGAEEIRTVPARPGVIQSYILVRPASRPVATVVLFAGGNGLLSLGSGRLTLGGNFLVRNRIRFSRHGLLVAVLDSPSDRPNGLDGLRTTAAHAGDVRALLAALRADAAVPVWLIGTSMGTVSAANAAARLTTGGPDGVVLSSSVTRPGRERSEKVGDVRLSDISVPTLVIHHRDDACRATPYADMAPLLRDLKSTPRRDLLTFEGGDPPQSGPCDARSAHGFLGIEAEVVAAIARWITESPRP